MHKFPEFAHTVDAFLLPPRERTRFMERLSRIVHTAGRIVRSRLFAVSVLAAATVLMAAIASVITHAVTVTDEIGRAHV